MKDTLDKRLHGKYICTFQYGFYADMMLVESVFEKVHRPVNLFFDVYLLPNIEDIVTDISDLFQVIQNVIQLMCRFVKVGKDLTVLFGYGVHVKQIHQPQQACYRSPEVVRHRE